MTPMLFEVARMLAAAGVFLVVGVCTGQVYFEMLGRASALMVAGARPRLAIALTVGRFALAGAALAVSAASGAAPLIGMTLGIVAGRWLVMRVEGRSI